MDWLKGVFGSFLIILMGAVFIAVIANSTTDATQAVTVTNESFAYVNGTTVSLDNNQLVSFTSLGNGSTTLDLTTDYTVDLDQGTVACSTTNTSVADGTYDATYVYRKVGDSTSRTLVTLVIVFFAIGLLGFVLSKLYPGFKDAFGF